MKKSISLIIGAAFVFASSFSILMAQSEGGDKAPVKKWHQEKCPDNTTYEICLYIGDGNDCSPYLAKTRECFATPADPNN